MRVRCEIEETTLTGDYTDRDGNQAAVAGLCARCSRCDNETEVYGTGEASVKAALVLLRESCPREEDNFYVAAE